MNLGKELLDIILFVSLHFFLYLVLPVTVSDVAELKSIRAVEGGCEAEEVGQREDDLAALRKQQQLHRHN